MVAPGYLKRAARRGPAWRETVLANAVARIAYHRIMESTHASWVKLGLAGASQLLRAGVNDLGDTLTDENNCRAAGAAHGQSLLPDDFVELALDRGRKVRKRTSLYEWLPQSIGPVEAP
ncbi:hypothetical protein [Nostocoides australiense]